MLDGLDLPQCQLSVIKGFCARMGLKYVDLPAMFIEVGVGLVFGQTDFVVLSVSGYGGTGYPANHFRNPEGDESRPACRPGRSEPRPTNGPTPLRSSTTSSVHCLGWCRITERPSQRGHSRQSPLGMERYRRQRPAPPQHAVSVAAVPPARRSPSSGSQALFPARGTVMAHVSLDSCTDTMNRRQGGEPL